MSYDITRKREQLRVLEPEIANFIVRYNASNGPLLGPRQTVFMFPGGMGSRLIRAKTKFNSAGPLNQVFAYDEVWLNPWTFLGGQVRNLQMTNDPPGDYRDKGERIVVAERLTNLFGFTPYVGFINWCETAQLDYFVFPWDWRRSIHDVGQFFIDDFLPHFQSLVQAGCNNADPLSRFSLIGHSAGGMVVNWALRSAAPIMAGLRKAITVGTPFYGYSEQLHRWFEGEHYLNGLYGKQDVINLICSFPGAYAWQFLPYSVYNSIKGALAADLNYPLQAYPSVDDPTGAIADPYYPQTSGPQQSYPSSPPSNFSTLHLAVAEAVVTFLASPLTPAQSNKFFNIRGDNTAGKTLSTTKWHLVPPTNPCPITDTAVTNGDGAQPAWTARHVDLDLLQFPPHVITIRSDLAQHTFLMSEPQTLFALAGILALP